MPTLIKPPEGLDPYIDIALEVYEKAKEALESEDLVVFIKLEGSQITSQVYYRDVAASLDLHKDLLGLIAQSSRDFKELEPGPGFWLVVVLETKTYAVPLIVEPPEVEVNCRTPSGVN